MNPKAERSMTEEAWGLCNILIDGIIFLKVYRSIYCLVILCLLSSVLIRAWNFQPETRSSST